MDRDRTFNEDLKFSTGLFNVCFFISRSYFSRAKILRRHRLKLGRPHIGQLVKIITERRYIRIPYFVSNLCHIKIAVFD